MKAIAILGKEVSIDHNRLLPKLRGEYHVIAYLKLKRVSLIPYPRGRSSNLLLVYHTRLLRFYLANTAKGDD
jgi:hypothetical protein